MTNRERRLERIVNAENLDLSKFYWTITCDSYLSKTSEAIVRFYYNGEKFLIQASKSNYKSTKSERIEMNIYFGNREVINARIDINGNITCETAISRMDLENPEKKVNGLYKHIYKALQRYIQITANIQVCSIMHKEKKGRIYGAEKMSSEKWHKKFDDLLINYKWDKEDPDCCSRIYTPE